MTATEDVEPIFIRALSRSGGTLLVTLLDAHPDVSMSYELYPNLLVPPDGTGIDVCALADALDNAQTLKAAAEAAPTPQFATFVRRLPRGGLDHHDLARLLREVDLGHAGLDSIEGRYRLMGACAALKQQREGTSRWGMKSLSNVEEYLTHYPKSRFVNLVRDGRDVLASQLHTGAFNPDPAKLGRSWVRTHQLFEKLAQRYPTQVRSVRYEDLVGQPDTVLPELLDFLDLPADEAVFRHDTMNLTIHGANHLSGARVAQPVDAVQVGRWKRDLAADQLAAFTAVAGDTLRAWGYE